MWIFYFMEERIPYSKRFRAFLFCKTWHYVKTHYCILKSVSKKNFCACISIRKLKRFRIFSLLLVKYSTQMQHFKNYFYVVGDKLWMKKIGMICFKFILGKGCSTNGVSLCSFWYVELRKRYWGRLD